MALEVRSDALAMIQRFCRQLDAEESLAERFRADPVGVLQEFDIDLAFPVETGFQSLGQMISVLDEESRLVTIKSIGLFAGHIRSSSAADPRPQQVRVFVIANANAAANANAGANANAVANANAGANANVNANTNASGFTGLANESVLTKRISVFDDYGQSEAAQLLEKLHLNPTRQLALLKRAVVDGESVTQSATDGAQQRITRYTFHGSTFEVESLVTTDAVEVVGVNVI